jgi:type IX secretion system PorP/SprF family membrane protein
MDGTARASVNYRSQWANVDKAFSTITGSLDGIILQSKIPTGDRLGIGLMAMSDKVAGGLMTNNYVSFSAAYHKGFDKDGNYSLGVGLQGTYAQRSIDGTKLIFNDQLDELGKFSLTSKDAGANNSGLRRNYFDAAAGMLFKARINDRNQFYIGVSAYHLGSPKVTFMSNTQLTVPVRLSLNGVYEAKLGDMVSLSLLGLYTQQEEASEAVVGSILTIGRSYREFDKTPIFYAGVLYRTKDAVIPYVAAEYMDIRFGCSYDYNTSALNAATKGQGGVEMSLVYLLRIPPNKKIQYLCPNNPKF